MAEQHPRTSVIENDPRVIENDRRQQQPDAEEIRNRAHEIYERRGREPGHDVDDWLEAERELSEKDE